MWRADPGGDRTEIVIDLDASIITTKADKQDAAPTWKRTYGHHPLFAIDAERGEILAQLLRPGNARSNTAVDHVTVLGAAIDALPEREAAGHPCCPPTLPPGKAPTMGLPSVKFCRRGLSGGSAAPGSAASMAAFPSGQIPAPATVGPGLFHARSSNSPALQPSIQAAISARVNGNEPSSTRFEFRTKISLLSASATSRQVFPPAV